MLARTARLTATGAISLAAAVALPQNGFAAIATPPAVGTPPALIPWLGPQTLPVVAHGTVGAAASLSYPGATQGAIVTTPYGPLRSSPLRSTLVAKFTAAGALERSKVVPWTTVAAPQFDAAGRGLMIGGSTAAAKYDIGFATVDGSGRVSSLHHLSTAARSARLAVDSAGDAVATWIESLPGADQAGAQRFRVRVAVGSTAKGLGTPRTLLTTGDGGFESEGLTAAVGTGGRAVVAFTDNGGPTARSKGRVVRAWTGFTSHRFGRAISIGSHSGTAQMASAVTSTGRAVIAWGTQGRGEEAGSSWVVRSASIAPNASKASKAQTLDAGGERRFPVSGLQLVAAHNGGTATLAWSGVGSASARRRGAGYPVQVATAGASGRFGAVQVVAPSGAFAGLAVRDDGAAIVTWGQLDGGNDDSGAAKQSLAAVRAPNSPTFGAGEPLAVTFPGDTPAPTFTPAGAAAVAWTAPGHPGGDLLLSTRQPLS